MTNPISIPKFHECFGALKDGRIDRKKLYPLEEILFLLICGAICGAESWRDFVLFGKEKIGFLRQYFSFTYGIPSKDTLARVFESLNPVAFKQAFLEWVQCIQTALSSDGVIALDGKRLCGSHDLKNGIDAMHMVCAFGSETRLVLAQEKVFGKSNEIFAMQRLLDLASIEGNVITIDAMGCQTEIAHKIHSRGGYYVLALKANQGNLCAEVQDFFEKCVSDRQLQDKEIDEHKDTTNSTTICRFRGALADKGVFGQILEAVMKQLTLKGVRVTGGSIVDATIIQSAARPKKESIAAPTDSDEDGDPVYSVVSEKLSADKEATWTKKGNQSHFGYKAYFVASTEGFLESVHVQPANVSEVTQLSQIAEKAEQGTRLYADKGYASAENRKLLESRNLKDGIMHKAQRNTPLTKWQKLKNKLISKTRYVIEQSFGTLKRRLKFTRSSYMGLIRTTAQCALKAIALNLIKASNMLHHA